MARQKLGQHFLVKGRTLERIARAACGGHVPLAVEIGAGRGALTEHLLSYADRIVAIEKDAALAGHLRARWVSEPRVEILEGDALDVNWSQWGAGVLTGNLPYYVSTPIISRYLREPGALGQAVFLIQKEVGERITARPGSRDYGYFSVECQALAKPEYLFTVPPGAFRPPPKVDSAAIRLTPQRVLGPEDLEHFLGFVSVCFRLKRKTLRNNLANAYRPERYESLLGINRRAEQLSVAEFVELYRAITP